MKSLNVLWPYDEIREKQQITQEKREKTQPHKGKKSWIHAHTHVKFLCWIPLFTFYLSSSVFFFNFIYVCGFLGMLISARASNSLVLCFDFLFWFHHHFSLSLFHAHFYAQNDYSISFSYFNMDAHSHLLAWTSFFWFCLILNVEKSVYSLCSRRSVAVCT